MVKLRQEQGGFTLMEVLTVVCIVAVLAAILLPVLLSSKRRGSSADSISKLRQIGQAANLYEQAVGQYATRTWQLVAEGTIPASLCEAHNDASPRGMENEFIQAMAERYVKLGVQPAPRETDFKSSFIGAGAFGRGSETVTRRAALLGAGWLLDFTDTPRGTMPYPQLWEGTYRRLLFDGAVVTRILADSDCGGSPCRDTAMIFQDEKTKEFP
jgi:prepilin-type N-terminal cleavage/methylation domain-containing protein